MVTFLYVNLWFVIISAGTQQVNNYWLKSSLGDFACIFISMKTDEEGDGAFFLEEEICFSGKRA